MNETTRLVTDRPKPDDFKDFFAIYSDPATNLFNPAGPLTSVNAQTVFNLILEHWARYKFGVWIIRSRKNAEVIGFGGLAYRMYGPELKLNLGYRLAADQWGKGYATEIALYSIEYCFQVLQLREVFALVRPSHTASIRVLEKCSMVPVGELDDVPGSAPSLIYHATRN